MTLANQPTNNERYRLATDVKRRLPSLHSNNPRFKRRSTAAHCCSECRDLTEFEEKTTPIWKSSSRSCNHRDSRRLSHCWTQRGSLDLVFTPPPHLPFVPSCRCTKVWEKSKCAHDFICPLCLFLLVGADCLACRELGEKALLASGVSHAPQIVGSMSRTKGGWPQKRSRVA